MGNRFFGHPILNLPYIESRRIAQFITPIPKPCKRKDSPVQEDPEFDDGYGLSTRKQRYEPIPIINDLGNK